MFRVGAEELPPIRGVAVGAILLAVVVALILSLGSLVLVAREYCVLRQYTGDATAWPLATVGSLRHAVGWQVAFAAVVSLALVLSTAALFWFQRRHLASRQVLRQVKTLAHNILASIDHGVITTDLKGDVTSINSAAIKLMGVDFDCVDKPLEQISCSDLPLVEIAHQLARSHVPVRDRDFTLKSGARSLRIRADAHLLKDRHGQPLGTVFLLRDVTERVLMQERMMRMERFISIGALASGLHHELKNPLTALSLHVDLLEERIRSPDGQPVDELIGVIKAEMLRLNGVLETFRDFSSFQQLRVQPTKVSQILDNAVRLVQPQAVRQRVRMVGPEYRELPVVLADPPKLEQVVLNLLINALEAMPSGGVLSVKAAVVDSQVTVEVADTGEGIPDEVQKNLFEPYFSTKVRGTGMGLALVDKLIHQHGGRVDYETGPSGTTFRIAVPIRAAGESC